MYGLTELQLIGAASSVRESLEKASPKHWIESTAAGGAAMSFGLVILLGIVVFETLILLAREAHISGQQRDIDELQSENYRLETRLHEQVEMGEGLAQHNERLQSRNHELSSKVVSAEKLLSVYGMSSLNHANEKASAVEMRENSKTVTSTRADWYGESETNVRQTEQKQVYLSNDEPAGEKIVKDIYASWCGNEPGHNAR